MKRRPPRLLEMVDRFMDDPSNGINTQSSKRSYTSTLRRIAKELGNPPLEEIEPSQLVDWVFTDGLAPNTIANRRSIVVALFRWLAAEEILDRNVAAKLERAKTSRKAVSKGHWLTPAQLKSIVAACDDTPKGHRDKVVILTAMFTGLRRIELARLRWGHVDLDAGVLQVHGKGDKYELVGIPDQLVEALTEWQNLQPRAVTADDPVLCRVHAGCVPAFGIEEPVIVTGQPVTNKTIWRAVRQRAEAAGLPGVAPHDLRRSYASILKKQGHPVEDIQQMLRHSNIGTTQTYLEKDPSATVDRGRGFRLDL